MKTDATMTAEEHFRPTQHKRAHDVSGLPAFITASMSYQFCSVFCLFVPIFLNSSAI
jgi:hypothetical protein